MNATMRPGNTIFGGMGRTSGGLPANFRGADFGSFAGTQPVWGMEDTFTGGIHFQSNGPFARPTVMQTQGYGLDFNGNGRYESGADGVLLFDTNRNGRYDQSDVETTNKMMKAAKGDFDFNNDGKISMGERMQGAMLQRRFQQLDRNRDGNLSADEMQQGGGSVWKDRNSDGHINQGETHSVFNIPHWHGQMPNQRLDTLNPGQGFGMAVGNGTYSFPMPPGFPSGKLQGAHGYHYGNPFGGASTGSGSW